MDTLNEGNTMFFKLEMKDVMESPHLIYKDGYIAILDWPGSLLKGFDSMKTDIFIFTGCIKGWMQMDVNGKTYVLRPNDILFCRPGYLLSNYVASPDFSGRVMCFTLKNMLAQVRMDNDFWEKAFLIDANPLINSVQHKDLFNIYGKMINLSLSSPDRPYRKEVIWALLRGFIYELLAEVHQMAGKEKSDELTQGDLLFKRFIELITSKEIKPRFVNWYAEQLCVTPKYLSTVCKRVSGKTASDWIDKYIEMDITRLLKYSNLTIKEMSDHLGFPNMSFFGKYVRNHLGMSPKVCRKMLRDNKTP